MTSTPLSQQQLDEIDAKAAELRTRIDRKNPWPSDNESHWTTEGWKAGTRNALDKLHVEALLAEVARLSAELEHMTRERDAFRDQRNGVFKTNERLLAEVQESDQARLRAENETRTVRREARALTESEHNAAWHAIEGAAGEDMADPGTVLNAVLHALGITPPAPSAVVAGDGQQQ